MAKIRIIDPLDYPVAEPDVPLPYPRIIVWGDDFFLAIEADVLAGVDMPRYKQTSGYVINDTRECGSGIYKLP